jgi:hypothetical protein
MRILRPESKLACFFLGSQLSMSSSAVWLQLLEAIGSVFAGAATGD